MSKLTWSALTSVKERDPLASEVSTLCLSQVFNFSHLFYLENFLDQKQNIVSTSSFFRKAG
jgi:hypothetical protein